MVGVGSRTLPTLLALFLVGFDMMAIIPLIVTMALAQPAPTTAPADAALAAARREERDDLAAATTRPGVRLGEPARLEDLVQATVRNGFLVVTTPLPADGKMTVRPVVGPGGGFVWLAVGLPNGLPNGPAQPAAGAADADGGAGPTPFVNLSYRRAGGPDADDVVTYCEFTANREEGQLDMVRNRAGVDERRSERVTLLQFPPTGDVALAPVRLFVDVDDADRPERNVKRSATAENLADLSRREPELFDEFVRPMLADFGFAAVLDGRTRAEATQAFFDELPRPDAATTANVSALLKQLDAPDYAARNAAQERLEAMGVPAALALAAVPRPSLSPEQASRVASVLSAYRPLPPEQAAALRDEPAFLRNVLKLDGQPQDAALRDLAQRRLDALGQH